MLNKTAEVDVSGYVTNGEWMLIKYTITRNEVVYPISPAIYPDVTIILIIQRRILYYVLNILFPCFWLNILSVLTFCLPPDAGEKLTLSITVLLSYSVFMLLVAESMPPTSEFVPLIGEYDMSRGMRKLVFGVSVNVRHKSGCTATDRQRLEISDLASRGIALLHNCAVMCAFVFTYMYAKSRFSHDAAHTRI